MVLSFSVVRQCPWFSARQRPRGSGFTPSVTTRRLMGALPVIRIKHQFGPPKSADIPHPLESRPAHLVATSGPAPIPGLGRYCEFGARRSTHRRGADHLARALPLLYFVELAPAPPALARANECLMLVSVSSPAGGHRQQPLQCDRTAAPVITATRESARPPWHPADSPNSFYRRRSNATTTPALAGGAKIAEYP